MSKPKFPLSPTLKRAPPRHRYALLLTTVATTALLTFLATNQPLLRRLPILPAAVPIDPTPAPDPLALAAIARHTFPTWLRHLRALHNNTLSTTRLGCREYASGAQSCAYEGLICVNTTADAPDARHAVSFVDDTKPDGEEVPSDRWCSFRYFAADPRYFDQRHWPIWTRTVAPQMSCLYAKYRHATSLLAHVNKRRIKWLPSLWFLDLDYPKSDHNNDFLIDAAWLLDLQLFHDSLSFRPPPGLPPNLHFNDTAANLFADGPRHLYLPQSRYTFTRTTSRDVNRLLYALLLRLDTRALYPNTKDAELHAAPKNGAPRYAAPLLEAYPQLLKHDRILFHDDLRIDPAVDLVCAPRFTTGAKRCDLAHERVCRHMRQRGYELFGVRPPPVKLLGRIKIPQPPRRVVVLQRHLTRAIGNLEELEAGLRKRLEKPFGVEVEVVSTAVLRTAEDFVRIYSRAGVLLSPHGSQNMGQIWMPRHSALIEIMPVGIADYAFELLSQSCKVFFYEIRSLRDPNISAKAYERECGGKQPYHFNPCKVMKGKKVWVDIDEAVRVIRFALSRMGHDTGSLLENAPQYKPTKSRKLKP